MPNLDLPIETGLYRTRCGKVAQITETGSFAYGRNPLGVLDFWDLQTGEYVRGVRRSESLARAHDFDLVERIPTLPEAA